MKNWTEFFKMLPSILLLVIMLAIGFWGYGEYAALTTRLDTATQAIQGLSDTTTRIENGISAVNTSKVSREELDKSLDAAVEELIKKYKLRPSGGVSGSGHVPGHSNITPGVYADPTYSTDIYWPENKVGSRIKIASSMFNADTKEFTNVTSPIEFKLNIITAVDDEDNEAVFATLTAYGDTTYSIELTEVRSVKTYPKDNKWRLAPHVDIGIGTKFNLDPQIGADIGISPFAYGLTQDDNLIRAPRIGLAGNENDLWVEVQGSYNVAKHLPIFSDIWLSVGPCYDLSGSWGACVSITSSL